MKYLFNLLPLVVLAVAIWLVLDIRQKLGVMELKLQELKVSSESARPLAESLPSLAIAQPEDGALVLSNRIDIVGEAPENQMICLVVDEQIKAVTLPHNGQFEFADITAKRGENVFTVKAMTEDGKVVSLQTIHIKYRNPTVSYLAKNFTRGNREESKIALTFDGGYLANVSEEILDILKDKQVKCTMFLSGTYIRKHADLVRRMVAEGHDIGNHTWNHPHLTEFVDKKVHVTRSDVTREFVQKQLNETALAFQACTGTTIHRLWRAPYGEHNREIREWAAELGYRHIGWTIGHDWENNMDTLDWVSDTTSTAYRSAEEIYEKVLNFGNGKSSGANGAIVIMHLGSMRKHDFPHKMLPKIIDGLREHGYQLVRVSEMLD
ncbi:MAG: polysaccharide deacetylase family protein [bacterium]